MADVVVFCLLVGAVCGVVFGWRAVHNARLSNRVWRVDEIETRWGTQIVLRRGREIKRIGKPIPADDNFALEIEIQRNDARECAVALNHK